MSDGWQSVQLEDVEPIAVVGGTLLWRPLRRALDIGAFGINAYTAPNVGDDVVEEHTEKLLGHEEVYVVLSGRATFTLDEETLDAPAGTVVFIRDPTVKRHACATEPDTSVPPSAGGEAPPTSLRVGSTLSPQRSTAYRVTTRPWPPRSPRASSATRTTPPCYDLARAEALAGRPQAALEHLRRALELKPEFADDHARQDEDLTSLRDLPGWPL